jgi:predicted nucleic acid-binding protein
LNGYLLDTDVISMLAPSRAEASAAFIQWAERIDGEGRLFLSAVTVPEIEKGIALLEHKRAKARAAGLRTWLSGLVSTYADKIIGLDTATAALSGRLEAKAIAAGHNPGMADAAIAGIAEAHGLTILTGNTRHFAPFGVAVLSPDEAVASTRRLRGPRAAD